MDNGSSRACFLGWDGLHHSGEAPELQETHGADSFVVFPAMGWRDTDSVKAEDELETKHITCDMRLEGLECRMPQYQGDVLAMFSPLSIRCRTPWKLSFFTLSPRRT